MGSVSTFFTDFLHEIGRKVTRIPGARNHHLCVTHPPRDELGIDEFHQEEIYDYFKQAESDSIEDALNELGEDEFQEEEIRLMRIKFLSDLGN